MKTGIALGGGGAKGLAHIGVLKVLHEYGIVPDMVAGTSIGALVGALYLLRGEIKAVEEYALGFENSNLYPHLVPRPSSSGMISEKRIQAFLHGIFGTKRIEDLERPFFCPAADIRSGREVMFASGSLQRAVRASISVPVIFKPVCLRRPLPGRRRPAQPGPGRYSEKERLRLHHRRQRHHPAPPAAAATEKGQCQGKAAAGPPRRFFEPQADIRPPGQRTQHDRSLPLHHGDHAAEIDRHPAAQ